MKIYTKDRMGYKFTQDSYKFKANRSYGLHEGVDYPGTKKEQVKNILDGIINNVYKLKHTGWTVFIKHNLKFIESTDKYLDSIIYFYYAHLHKVFPTKGQFIKAGDCIGYKGNTGLVYTKYDLKNNYNVNNKWRTLTPEEMADINCNYGVHEHLSCYVQNQNRFFDDFFNIYGNDNIYKYRNNRIYLNPEKVIEFLNEVLNG